jgi:hypothetical protein
LRIAVLDAIYWHINQRDAVCASEEVEFIGTASEKSKRRARTIVDSCQIVFRPLGK